ncbi:MAG TPA: HDOD domain-containing protein [Planctomycetota bacterium]|nr:HDOD domain-containing protein [Planctomycetota bacterium]
MTTSSLVGNMADSMRIPTLSASVERIRAVLSTPDVAMPAVVAAFLTDPPLAAKVLKIANSAHYGLRSSTTSLQTAISVLGLRTLSMIVLRAGILTAYSETPDREDFSLEELWKHSILTAHASESLARYCRTRKTDMSPQDYYTCGLLHDIGKIVLYDNLGEQYVEAARQAHNHGTSLEAEEIKQLGMSHADAGAMAALLWKLPQPIPAIIRGHHRPSAAVGLVDVVSIVACADEIAHVVASQPLGDPEELAAGIKTHPGGLKDADLVRSISEAITSWNKLEL